MATQLMIDLCGARFAARHDRYRQPGPPLQTIRLREREIRACSASRSPRALREILTALEFGVADAPDGLDVSVPPSAGPPSPARPT